MKRMVFAALICVCAFFLFPIFAAAAEEEEILSDFESVIPSNVELDMDSELSQQIGIERVLAEIGATVGASSGGILAFFVTLFGFAILISSCGEGCLVENGTLRANMSVGASTVAAFFIFSSLYGVLLSVKEALLGIVSFFSSLIPILTAVNTASGAVGSAGTQATNMNITLALLERLCSDALLPLAFAMFVLSFIGSVSDGGVGNIASAIRSVFMWGIGIITTVLAGIMAIQSVVASASDNAVLRAARYAASGTIPIVGSSVASAVGILSGGMAFVKGSVGGGAVAVILILALAPLLNLLLYRLCFSICIFMLEFTGSAGGVRCFSAFKSSLDAVIAVYSMATLVCIVELVIFLCGGAKG